MNGCRSRLLPQLGGRTYMPTDIVMPQMGESIFEGTITKWLKKPGDKVQRDEPLFEISTDKVDAEIPAPASGVLQEIKVTEGTTVGVNTVVGTIAVDGEAASALRKPLPHRQRKKKKRKRSRKRRSPPLFHLHLQRLLLPLRLPNHQPRMTRLVPRPSFARSRASTESVSRKSPARDSAAVSPSRTSWPSS